MTIEDDIAFLERVPTLGCSGARRLRILAIGAESRYVHRGEVLFSAGDVADCGFVVQEGSFSLTPQQAEGGDSRRGRAAARCSASSRCSPRPRGR